MTDPKWVFTDQPTTTSKKKSVIQEAAAWVDRVEVQVTESGVKRKHAELAGHAALALHLLGYTMRPHSAPTAPSVALSAASWPHSAAAEVALLRHRVAQLEAQAAEHTRQIESLRAHGEAAIRDAHDREVWANYVRRVGSELSEPAASALEELWDGVRARLGPLRSPRAAVIGSVVQLSWATEQYKLTVTIARDGSIDWFWSEGRGARWAEGDGDVRGVVDGICEHLRPMLAV